MSDAKLDPSLRMGETLEVEVVRAFLRSLQRLDPDAATSLLAEDFVLSVARGDLEVEDIAEWIWRSWTT